MLIRQKRHQRFKTMKTRIQLFISKPQIHRFGLYLAATATVAALALGAESLSSRAHADSPREHRQFHELDELTEMYQKLQLAELHQLEEAFHLAGSYGGDIEAMMALWPDNATLTVGANVLTGKDAIRAFFAAGGPFHNNWIGLTPAFKFTADVHGDSAQISFQCDYVDPSVTPPVVRLDRIMQGTVKKVHGKWLFWHMNNVPATL
jgi:hypothetical protein